MTPQEIAGLVERLNAGAAASLYGSPTKLLEEAAAALKLTAPDLLQLGLIDGIIPEPAEGAHTDPDAAAAALRETLRTALAQLDTLSPEELVEQRYAKFRAMGNFFL